MSKTSEIIQIADKIEIRTAAVERTGYPSITYQNKSI